MKLNLDSGVRKIKSEPLGWSPRAQIHLAHLAWNSDIWRVERMNTDDLDYDCASCEVVLQSNSH
jgi:hypothetical protein